MQSPDQPSQQGPVPPPGGYPPALPPGGGYPIYGHPPPRRNNGMAIAAMVVSLASLVTCPPIGGVGIYLGHRSRAEIRQRGEDGEGFATAGIVVGWVAIGFTLLYVCFFIGAFGLSFGPLLFM